jgi:hypothetical protein
MGKKRKKVEKIGQSQGQEGAYRREGKEPRNAPARR